MKWKIRNLGYNIRNLFIIAPQFLGRGQSITNYPLSIKTIHQKMENIFQKTEDVLLKTENIGDKTSDFLRKTSDFFLKTGNVLSFCEDFGSF